VAYIQSQLDTSYYDVSLQGVELSVGINATLTANNKTIEAFATTLAPAGNVTGPLAVIPNLGCEEVSHESDMKPSTAILRNRRTSRSP